MKPEWDPLDNWLHEYRQGTWWSLISICIYCVGIVGVAGETRVYKVCPDFHAVNWYILHDNLINYWKRLSVDAPSRDVPFMSVFWPKNRQGMSRLHAVTSHDVMTSCCNVTWCQVSWQNDRQTHTHRQTGPILYPRLLTREGIKHFQILYA